MVGHKNIQSRYLGAELVLYYRPPGSVFIIAHVYFRRGTFEHAELCRLTDAAANLIVSVSKSPVVHYIVNRLLGIGNTTKANAGAREALALKYLNISIVRFNARMADIGHELYAPELFSCLYAARNKTVDAARNIVVKLLTVDVCGQSYLPEVT